MYWKCINSWRWITTAAVNCVLVSVSDSRHLRLVNCALPSNKFFFFCQSKRQIKNTSFQQQQQQTTRNTDVLDRHWGWSSFLQSTFLLLLPLLLLYHKHTHITSSICWQTGKNYWNGHLARTKRSPSREKAHTLTTIDSALHLNQHQQQQQQHCEQQPSNWNFLRFVFFSCPFSTKVCRSWKVKNCRLVFSSV